MGLANADPLAQQDQDAGPGLCQAIWDETSQGTAHPGDEGEQTNKSGGCLGWVTEYLDTQWAATGLQCMWCPVLNLW